MPAAHADPWLDRVETNLRRIQAATNYRPPVGTGSKAAARAHTACTKKNDEKACSKLIWRKPDLLPISDWAVGTAHIKRGEIREKRSDVRGALEDYQSALGYQTFPNLHGRIKRLKLRLEADAQAAKLAEQTKVATKPAQSKSAQPTLQAQGTITANHPVVVVNGWQPQVGAPSTDNRPVAQSVAAEAEKKTTKLANAPLSQTGSDPFAVQLPRRPKPFMSLRQASRYLPGHQTALNQLQQETKTQAEPIAVPRSVTPVIQFPVSEEIQSALSEVRRRTDAVITTSALPDRKGVSPKAVVHQSTAITAIVGFGLLFMTAFFFMMRGVPVFDFGRRKTYLRTRTDLSVEDLKTIVQKRSDEKLAARKAILASPLSPPPPPAPKITKDATNKVAAGPVSEPAVPGEGASSADEMQQVDDDVSIKPAADQNQQDATPKSVVAPRPPTGPPHVDLSDLAPRLGSLDDSVMRRVAGKQISLVMIGGTPQHAGGLLQCFSEDVQDQVAPRVEILDGASEEAHGILNPFWPTERGGDALAAKQHFNAAFECLCCVFDHVFGARFVRQNRVHLRHLVLLVQEQPEPSLKSLLDCLENRQSLSAFENDVARIDNVSARLFFTTTFATSAFAQEADHMKSSLKSVLGSATTSNLCASQPDGHMALRSLVSTPRILWVPLDADGMTRARAGLIVSSLLHRFARPFGDALAARGDASPLTLVPPSLDGFGENRSGLKFLIDEVKSAGVTVL